MSVPILIDIPSRCAESVVMSITRVIGLTSSPFTLEEQAFDWGGEQWKIDFVVPPTTKREVAADWQAFGLKAKGRFNCFLLGDPAARRPMGVATGTPLVDGNNQTGNTLITKGWTPSVAGILKRGDYIQIGIGLLARLHMVVDDVNSDPSGNASINIHPALRFSPADNAAITTDNPKGVFRMSDNNFSWGTERGGIYRFNFSALEVLNA